jgi:hypothetical protein
MLVTVRAGLAAQMKRGTACAIPPPLAVTDKSRVALQLLAALRCLLSSQHPGPPDPTPAPPRSVPQCVLIGPDERHLRIAAVALL